MDLTSEIVDNRGRTCPAQEHGIPLIATNCIRNENLYPSYEKLRYVSQETYDNWFRGHPKPGDILFVCKGSPGRVCWVPDPIEFCIAQDMVAIRADAEKVDSKYLFALLRSPKVQHQIGNMHVGTLIPHFKKGDFKNLYLKIFEDLKYQKNVGQVYFAYCEKIDLNRQFNQTLEQIAQAIFKSWFVDFEPVKAKQHIRAVGGNDEQTERASQAIIAGAVNLDVITTATDLSALDQQLVEALSEKFVHQTAAQREQLIATASHFPDQLVESNLGKIPAGWDVSDFSEIATSIRDSINPTTIDGEIPYVGLEHIEKKRMYLTSWGHASDVSSNKVRFKKGDYLFGKLRPYFHKVCKPPIAGICSTDILVIRAVSDDWKGFIQYQIFDPVFVEFANVRSTGTRMPRANWTDMGGYRFAKPNIDVAKAFTEIAVIFDQMATENTTSYKSLASLRELLLPRLFSGELVQKKAS